MEAEFYAVIGPCGSCKRLFMFHPDLVPSFKDDTSPTVDTDPWLPICRACVNRVNPLREQAGSTLIDVLPGAYPDELQEPISMRWNGPVVLADFPANGVEHEAVDAYDRADRATSAAFAWYVAAVGPDAKRNQEIADGLRWTGGGFVTEAEDEVLNRSRLYRVSFYPVIPGDRSRWHPAF